MKSFLILFFLWGLHAVDLPLSIIDAGVAPRITNVGVNTALYSEYNLPQACCVNPYDPFYHSFPVVVKYDSSLLSILPEFVLQKVSEENRSKISVYLNIQDTPWPKETPALIRAHPLFNSMGNRQAKIKVLNDIGEILLESTGNIHSHDAIASPNNFAILGIDVSKTNVFWSIVECELGTILTRHILLTTEQNQQLLDNFFSVLKQEGEPESLILKDMFAGNLTSKLFLPLLTKEWSDYIKNLGVIIS